MIPAGGRRNDSGFPGSTATTDDGGVLCHHEAKAEAQQARCGTGRGGPGGESYEQLKSSASSASRASSPTRGSPWP
jgi:hypothetical protein